MLFPDISSIKHKRKALGLTQNQLSKETSISQSLIAKLEAKKVSPSYEIVKKIFDTFEKLEHKKESVCSQMLNKNKKLVSIKPQDTIKHAVELMKVHAISQLPVIEKARVIGNIEESDIYNKILEEDKNKLFRQQVREIMQGPLPLVPSTTPSSVAMPLLKTNSAILLTEKDKIIGILTKEDFIVKS